MTGVEELTLAAVTVKVAELEPCGTVIDAGIVTVEGEGESMTTAPPDGAAAVSCIVPVADWPLVIALGEIDMLLRAAGKGFTMTPAVMVAPE